MAKAKVKVRLNVPLRVVVYPAPDVPNVWISHCLELDLVSQGDSKEHALTMLRQAIDMTIEANIEQGWHPLPLHPAPREVWEAYGVEIPEQLEMNISLSMQVAGSESGAFTSEAEPPTFIPIVRTSAHAG